MGFDDVSNWLKRPDVAMPGQFQLSPFYVDAHCHSLLGWHLLHERFGQHGEILSCRDVVTILTFSHNSENADTPALSYSTCEVSYLVRPHGLSEDAIDSALQLGVFHDATLVHSHFPSMFKLDLRRSQQRMFCAIQGALPSHHLLSHHPYSKDSNPT